MSSLWWAIKENERHLLTTLQLLVMITVIRVYFFHFECEPPVASRLSSVSFPQTRTWLPFCLFLHEYLSPDRVYLCFTSIKYPPTGSPSAVPVLFFLLSLWFWQPSSSVSVHRRISSSSSSGKQLAAPHRDVTWRRCRTAPASGTHGTRKIYNHPIFIFFLFFFLILTEFFQLLVNPHFIFGYWTNFDFFFVFLTHHNRNLSKCLSYLESNSLIKFVNNNN